MSLLKIFVSAYACEPGLGSESGVGWHWVVEMSKYFEVWVLTRKSNKPAIERWAAEHPTAPEIHFLYFDLPKWARFWKKGLQGVHLYYYLWQSLSNRLVKQTMQGNEIRIFHHLTYGNALWKVSSYGQKQCFVWGPVGGLETIPTEYSKHYHGKSRIKEYLRQICIGTVKWNRAFRLRCDYAKLILCKTDITRQMIARHNQSKAILFTDVALNEPAAPAETSPQNKTSVNYLMVGRLDAWRGFDIAIEGFSKASQKCPAIRLEIVGRGEDQKRIEQLIRDRKMEDRITLHGEVPSAIYEAMLTASDVVINPSLKEGSVTVSFESIALGKPLICVDTTGHTRLLEGFGAIVIPRESRAKVIENLTEAICRLAEAHERENLRASSHGCDKRPFTWEEQGKAVRDKIHQTYNQYCLDQQLHER